MTPCNIAGMAMLNGLNVAALTDHNTSKNCPAFFAACEALGVLPMAGMELTTLEEIHLVCLFPTLADAMAFDSFAEEHRMRVKNRPEIFGEQIIMDENDVPIGKEEDLLILATDLDLTEASREVFRRGGAAFPAHIEKASNSVLAILGDIPPEPGFGAAELFDLSKLGSCLELCRGLGNMTVISNSDAHMLESMRLDPPELEITAANGEPDTLRRAIISFLRGDALPK